MALQSDVACGCVLLLTADCIGCQAACQYTSRLLTNQHGLSHCTGEQEGAAGAAVGRVVRALAAQHCTPAHLRGQSSGPRDSPGAAQVSSRCFCLHVLHALLHFLLQVVLASCTQGAVQLGICERLL